MLSRPPIRGLTPVPPGLPAFEGKPVHVRFLAGLTGDGKRVYSNQERGTPVHAGTLIRKRVIVLDDELRRNRKELARILVHELLHFSWVRLSNQRRASYEQLIEREFSSRARGELGWSAEWRKLALLQSDAPRKVRKWRDYLCESFCDTGAWLYAGIRSHGEFTLARTHRQRRAQWFQSTYRSGGIPI
jgi:hypothetical protein